VIALSRRQFICGGAAVAALAATPAVAATGIKSLPGGKTEVSLTANKALAEVGGVVEFAIKKYGKVALVRTSKAKNGFAAFSLACPHAGVTVVQSSGGWKCPGPRGHGSEFGLNGSLKLGPANSPLKSLKITATSKAVTIA
jgi:Rieske Fe-S protein